MATMPIKQDFRLLLCSSLLRCTENNSTLIWNCLLTNTVPFLTPLVQLDPTLLTQVEGRGARGCGQQCVKQAVQEGQTRDPELSEENGQSLLRSGQCGCALLAYPFPVGANQQPRQSHRLFFFLQLQQVLTDSSMRNKGFTTGTEWNPTSLGVASYRPWESHFSSLPSCSIQEEQSRGICQPPSRGDRWIISPPP